MAAPGKSFDPKQAVQLDPPKTDPIGKDYLEKCDGELSLLLEVCPTKPVSNVFPPKGVERV
jgi:hypothetical protein